MGWSWATVCASDEFSSSCHITKPLSDYLLNRKFSYMNVKLNSLPGNLPYIILNMHEQHSNFSSKLRWRLSQLALDLTTEKGASNWLTALPLQEYWFTLHVQVCISGCNCSTLWLISTPNTSFVCLWLLLFC